MGLPYQYGKDIWRFLQMILNAYLGESFLEPPALPVVFYQNDGVGRPEGPPTSDRSFDVYLPRQRYRKVTIWARVQSSSGPKVVAEVPTVMPFPTAHSTASV